MDPWPSGEPTDDELIRLANIVTGICENTAQSLPPGHIAVKQLEPYTRWLYHHLNRHQPAQPDVVGWFKKTVTFFSNNPDGQITKFIEVSRPDFVPERNDIFIRDLALSYLSYWLTVDILYRVLDPIDETRQTINNCVADLGTASEQNKQPRSEEDIRGGKISIKELMYNGKLIPRSETYTDPFKAINANALNVHQLVKFGRLKVKWTTDISQHLRIVEEDKHLYVFCMPCIFSVQANFSSTKAVQAFQNYIPEQYTDEILRSYWLLFGSSRRGRISFKQALRNDRDIDFNVADEKVLERMAINQNQMDTVWAREKFLYLWPRILELKSHLDSSQPESWWGLLWHDRSQPYVWVPALTSRPMTPFVHLPSNQRNPDDEFEADGAEKGD